MNQNSVLKTALQYGAYSGLSSFIFFLVIYFTGHNPLGAASWLGAWIPIVFIVLGTKYHRNNDLEGYMNYGRGLGIGTLIALCASIIISMSIYIFGTVVDAKILEPYLNEMMEATEKAKSFMSEELYDKGMEQITKMTMKDVAWSNFYNVILGGFIVSLITAAIYRKEKPFFEQDKNE